MHSVAQDTTTPQIDWALMEQRRNLALSTIAYVLAGMGHPQEFNTAFSVDPITFPHTDKVSPGCFDIEETTATIKLALGSVALTMLWKKCTVPFDVSIVFTAAHEATHAGQYLEGRLTSEHGGNSDTRDNPAEHYSDPLEREAFDWSIRAVRFLLDMPEFTVNIT